MTNLTLSEKIRKARRDSEFSQTKLAELINVSLRTLQRIEDGADADIGLIRKIAQATEKTLFYFLSEEEVEHKTIKELKEFGMEVSESGKKSDSRPILSYEDIYNKDKLAVCLKKGDSMRVRVADNDNDPDIRFGDILDVSTKFDIEEGRYYVVRDKQDEKIIIRPLNIYSGKKVLITKNWNHSSEFDVKRYEIMGRVVKHEREL